MNFLFFVVENQVIRAYNLCFFSESTAIVLYFPDIQFSRSEQYHFENLRSDGPPAILVFISSVARSITILNDGAKVVCRPALSKTCP